MADRRMLSRTISHNEQLASVPLAAALLFTWCLPHLDRDGRMSGNPALVKSVAVPLRPELTVENIPGLLAALRTAGLVRWYEVDGKRVLWFPGFRAHQTGMKYDREKESGLPPYNPDTCLDCPEGPVRTDAGPSPELFGLIGSLKLNLKETERGVLSEGHATHAHASDGPPPVDNSRLVVENSTMGKLDPPPVETADVEHGKAPGGDDRDGRGWPAAVGGLSTPVPAGGEGAFAQPEHAGPRSHRAGVVPDPAHVSSGSGGTPPRAPAGLSDEDAALADLARDFHARQDRIRAAKGNGGPSKMAVAPPVRVVPVPGADGLPMPEHLSADQVVALWASRQGFPPDDASLQRQADAARWLAEHPAEHVVRAMYGMPLLFPHSKGEPWTLEHVRKRWPEALQASENHPDLVDARTARRIKQRANGGG